MAVAVFDYALWIATYPEFAATVPQPLAQQYFTLATLTLDNTDCSPVQDVTQRLALLNMLVAHIAATMGPGATNGGLVGRVSSATEGTVSVSSEYMGASASSAWFLSSPYGALFWQSTRGLRTARYIPARPYQQEPFGAFRRGAVWPR